MESLYEMDVFIDSNQEQKHQQSSPTKLPSYSQTMIDPYSLSKTINQGQTYRERVAIMELACIDRQIEQYNLMSNNHSNDDAIVDYDNRNDEKVQNEDDEENKEGGSTNVVGRIPTTTVVSNVVDKNDVYTRIESIYNQHVCSETATEPCKKESVYARIGKIYQNSLAVEFIVDKNQVHDRIGSIYNTESISSAATTTTTFAKKTSSRPVGKIVSLNSEQMKVYERINRIYKNNNIISSTHDKNNEQVYQRIKSIYGCSSTSKASVDKDAVYTRIASIFKDKTIPNKEDVYNRIGFIYNNCSTTSSSSSSVDVTAAVYERVDQIYNNNDVDNVRNFDKNAVYSRISGIYNGKSDNSTVVDKNQVYDRVGTIFHGGEHGLIQKVDKESIYSRICRIYDCADDDVVVGTTVNQDELLVTGDCDAVENKHGKEAVYERIYKIYSPDSTAAASSIDKEHVYQRIGGIYNPKKQIGSKSYNYRTPLNSNQVEVYRRIGGIYNSGLEATICSVDKEAVYKRIGGIFTSSKDMSCKVDKSTVYSRVRAMYNPHGSKVPSVPEESELNVESQVQNSTKNENRSAHSDIFSELYAVDLEMDHRRETIQEKDDIHALMELYSVDQKVENRDVFMNDRVKTIFNELVEMDMKVDGNKGSGNEENEFIDPITELMLREVGVISSPSRKEKCWDVKDIMELLSTDRFVEGFRDHAETKDNDIMKHLHRVDCDVDEKTRVAEEKKKMEQILDLYQLDQEIDSKANKSRDVSLASIPKEVIMDDMDAIVALYQTDLQVEDARYNAHFKTQDAAVYHELWKTDVKVDKIGVSATLDLSDPFTKSTLNQYAQEGNAIASRLESNVCEIMELYAVDMEVGAASSRHRNKAAEEAMAHLIKVDEEVEQMSKKKLSSTVTSAFSSKKIDNNNQATESEGTKSIEKPVEKVKQPVKRSIFTEREMKASEEGQKNFDSYQREQSFQSEKVDIQVVKSDASTAQLEEEPPRRKKGFLRSIFSQREKSAAAKADRFGRRR